MKALILAAGEGTRLRPYTENIPKCMVKFFGRPILNYIEETLTGVGIEDIYVVGGYKVEKIKIKAKKIFVNKSFNTTNMVESLFLARELLGVDDLIISYSDIIYTKEILKKLIDDKAHCSVVSDKKWKALWDKRMDDIYSDVESFKLKPNGSILELGKKPINLNEVEGQFIGLIKISKEFGKVLCEFYDKLDKQKSYFNRPFQKMYMTDFLQLLINNGNDISPVFTEGEWIEIDTVQDLEIYLNDKEFIKSRLNLSF